MSSSTVRALSVASSTGSEALEAMEQEHMHLSEAAGAGREEPQSEAAPPPPRTPRASPEQEAARLREEAFQKMVEECQLGKGQCQGPIQYHPFLRSVQKMILYETKSVRNGSLKYWNM